MVPITPISPSGGTDHPPQRGFKEKATMGVQDRNLAVLYWQLQKMVHTDPTFRTYLYELTRILEARRIRPMALNDVGLEMAMQNQL